MTRLLATVAVTLLTLTSATAHAGNIAALDAEAAEIRKPAGSDVAHCRRDALGTALGGAQTPGLGDGGMIAILLGASMARATEGQRCAG